jgi:glycosyltransferase involved in cell wall biosynthesis
MLNALHAQAAFPAWARHDRINIFWSPRHHLPLLSGRPAVVTIHDMVWKRHGQTMVRLGRMIEQLLMPLSLRRAQAVIAVSHATAADIVAFYPEIEDKIVVVPEATSLQDITPGSQELPAQPYMLFVGTMEPRKNLNAVLDAYRLLLDSGVTTHRLVVAGNPGWKNAEIHLKLQREPFTTNVDLCGKVSDEHLVALYRGADFVVAPSLYEGFGLVVLEAMAFGKPVITADTSSLPEVAGDAALLVDPTSLQAIEIAMRALIENRDLHERLSRDGIERARQFSWERAAEDTLNVLLSVAGRP